MGKQWMVYFSLPRFFNSEWFSHRETGAAVRSYGSHNNGCWDCINREFSQVNRMNMISGPKGWFWHFGPDFFRPAVTENKESGPSWCFNDLRPEKLCLKFIENRFFRPGSLVSTLRAWNIFVQQSQKTKNQARGTYLATWGLNLTEAAPNTYICMHYPQKNALFFVHKFINNF